MRWRIADLLVPLLPDRSARERKVLILCLGAAAVSDGQRCGVYDSLRAPVDLVHVGTGAVAPVRRVVCVLVVWLVVEHGDVSVALLLQVQGGGETEDTWM